MAIQKYTIALHSLRLAINMDHLTQKLLLRIIRIALISKISHIFGQKNI
ncbi:hypothetical protein NBRC111893_1467 [Lentilactobacillus kosonis]|uniref:Uncharacterized protein n=1 Tax=Lentilactobacillus kosonis TaxID=2810561 RepID=A0A401FM86_9LACO|nr:hypothetical protein NBRC111893_1467 [Lentilactobacillus kosonis]